ncbi:DUF2982 domain-containing protein [Rheinheimera sp. UJ51]|uniref:DUF2982 domain-containing protein n=1 Tax=unclassified Rheinheimera TaxID=115860 RepID=UPI001E3CE99A|nr:MULTISPECIES: DUF2982 domain-containing protein [unclassified Rheinheimera]MCC5450974.1 DUF2982 domain-containing protein [Rheinheimera sp. UJ51]MCF4007959.1 DUF2982 domain-containing protein [Rheinheimera sp. UJ63]
MSKLALAGSASSGGAKLLLLSVGTLFVLFIYTLLLAEQFNWLLAVAYIASFMGIFIGWAKLAEPKYSIDCDELGVHYHHRAGSWLLPWQAFSYSAVPSIGGEDLAFIGFKVTDYDAVLAKLPLRLAVKIMTEQRPIFLEAIKQSCSIGQCATELLREKDHFSTAKQQYDGVKAIFAQRMQRITAACGFELLVPVNAEPATVRKWCQDINRLRLQQLHPDDN